MNYTERRSIDAETKYYEFLIDTKSEVSFLKFQYKTGQDPQKVAQLFIDNNGIQQSYLSRIVKHLLENIPESNTYTGIADTSSFLSSTGSFFIIYLVAVVVLVVSFVIGWKLPDLISSTKNKGYFGENDHQFSNAKPNNGFLKKVWNRKYKHVEKEQPNNASTELQELGSLNSSMYQTKLKKAEEKCNDSVEIAKQQFQKETEQLNKNFKNYKARKSFERAKKEADDKFNEDFKFAEEKRAEGMTNAKETFLKRLEEDDLKKIEEGEHNITEEEDGQKLNSTLPSKFENFEKSHENNSESNVQNAN